MRTVSVLIAAYNADRWLGDCLNSVFSQRLPPGWETQVLLGIDGCKKTLEFLRRREYPKVEAFYMQRNRGTYITFNTLMQYARGELIARFDADDVMKDNYLSEQIAAIEAGNDLTMSWSIYTDEDLKPTSCIPALADYRTEHGHRTRGTDGQFVIRRSVWERLGGFQSWPCGADTEFVIRAEVAGFRQTVLEHFLYLRRTHPNSLTAHIDTNYDSYTRIKVQEMTVENRDQYRAGTRPLSVEPETNAMHVRIPGGEAV